MLGAIIGDTAGSRFEFANRKTKQFTLLRYPCCPTDDSVMTLAVADAILTCDGDWSKLPELAVTCMQAWGRRYPHAGYGGKFRRWLRSPDPQPYNSWGNGAAMRVSACGWAGSTIEEVKALSRAVTAVTHNHPEGLKGAEAIAVAVFLTRTGSSKEALREYITAHYYPLDFTLDEIRTWYSFDVSCQGSTPQALQAFFEADSFEDAIRNAISLGGDSDTIAAMAGAVAEAYYGVPAALERQTGPYLDLWQRSTLEAFQSKYGSKRAD